MKKQTANLVNRLDVIEKDKAFVGDILRSKLTSAQQQKRVRNLLSPPELKRYDAGMRMIAALGKVEPQKHPQSIDLREVTNIPPEAADGVKQWLQDNAKKIRVYGSLVDWLYVQGAKGATRPTDIDVAIDNSERAAKELATIIHDVSGNRVDVVRYAKQRGHGIVVVDDGKRNVAIDIHPMRVYEKQMPYGWDTKPSVMIDGIPFEQLGEQLWRRGMELLNPGVGIEGRGMMGVIAAQRKHREKDILKLEAIGRTLISLARKQGKVSLANAAENDLDILMGKPTKPYPVVTTTDVVPRTPFAPPVIISKLRKKKQKKLDLARQVGSRISQIR